MTAVAIGKIGYHERTWRAINQSREIMSTALIFAAASSLLFGAQSLNATLADARTPPVVKQAEPEHLTDKDLAEDGLKYLYTAYLAIKACTEASRELSKPEYMPLVSVDEARRIMSAADAAARDAGLDVDAAWIQAAPIGRTAANALKVDKPGNAERCRDVGPAFGSLLYRLQARPAKAWKHPYLIEKDF